MSWKSVEEQLEIIKKGCVELILEEELKKKLEKSIKENKPLRIKFGADPNRPDIHLGHTVPLNKLRQFQELGHKVVFIIGDFTGSIGDPSGRDATRSMISLQEAKKNAQTYFDQVGKILDIKKSEIRYNSEWLEKLNFAEVVRLASAYTVARMLERDDFEKRYEANQPISIQEFLYPLAQAYDSVMLNADVEIGGTDQKFNFAMTRDIQRSYGQQAQCILTLPLLPGTDGVQKMSKSLDNYIGISDTPKDIFGKIMSISDEAMLLYYDLLTDIAVADVKILHPMEAKKNLGEIIIKKFYDDFEAKKARLDFELVFSKKETPKEIPIISVDTSDLKDGKIWIIKLIRKANFAKTNGEAKRLIEQGGVSINEEKISNPNLDMEIKGELLLKVGSRNFAKFKLAS